MKKYQILVILKAGSPILQSFKMRLGGMVLLEQLNKEVKIAIAVIRV